MEIGGFQGWHPDPFGLHELRYFSAGRPTKLVRDGTVDSYDEPPAGAPRADPQAVEPGGFATGGAGASNDVGMAGYPSSRPDLFGGDSSVSWAGGGAYLAPRRPRRLLLTSVAVAVLAVAAVALIAIVGGKRPTHAAHGGVAISQVAFVTSSARRTLAEKTADLTLSGAMQAGGVTVPLHGTGKINMTTNTMALSLEVSASGHSVVEHEILANGNIYLSVTVDGRNAAALVSGRHWIREPLVGQSKSANITGGNPLAALAVLEQRGARVKSLGTKNIDGVSCRGYSVTPSAHAMLAGARQALAKMGLSPAQTDAELALLHGVTPPTLTVWFDSRRLTRQINVSLQMGGVAGAGSVSGQLAMNFTNYGARVHVSAPARSDTISFQQFLSKAGT